MSGILQPAVSGTPRQTLTLTLTLTLIPTLAPTLTTHPHHSTFTLTPTPTLTLSLTPDQVLLDRPTYRHPANSTPTPNPNPNPTPTPTRYSSTDLPPGIRLSHTSRGDKQYFTPNDLRFRSLAEVTACNPMRPACNPMYLRVRSLAEVRLY